MNCLVCGKLKVGSEVRENMIALDLFCGAGGASKGLYAAGFKRVVGVDFEKRGRLSKHGCDGY